MTNPVEAEPEDDKIGCRICGERIHAIQAHLKDRHNEMTVEEYSAQFPDAPIMSPKLIERLKERRRETPAPVALAVNATDLTVEKAFLNEVFGLGNGKAAMNIRTGAPIPITVVKAPASLAAFVPDKDRNYVFPIDLLKTALMALDLNKPMLAWGHSGTGKTTIFEQIAAHTGRPTLRIQHTRNTEESHLVGQWTVRDGATVFELGPLAFAMKFGLMIIADEYDFAMPSVLSVYQPVLEGKSLVIKEADAENRVIRPHPMFRIVATGNTNGTGDESGLYQGTLIQNAANYERFAIVEEVKYMDQKTETQVVMAQAGIQKEFAEKLVKFATACREAYAAQKLGLPPSPRAIINAALIGDRRGDWGAGLRLAYFNRLNTIDRLAVEELFKRVQF